MKRRTWGLGLLLAFALSFASLIGQQRSGAQTPAASLSSSTQQQPAGEEEVVRITTNLVQVDAVVTDKEGRVVTDLRAEDFEVFEDGRPQAVTNLSFVPLESLAAEAGDAGAAAKDKAEKRDRNAPPTPPAPTPARLQRPEQVRRTLALVAGNLSFASTDAVHDALKKYVDEQVQPNDLVAVISLGAASGALQQFTTDRRQLVRAVGKVRWLPSSGYEVDSIEPVRRNDTNTIRDGRPGTFESPDARATRERIDSTVGPACLRQAADVVALTHLVRRMRLLPGRKSVVYFSDGLAMTRGGYNGDATCIYNALRQLVDAAARASVVIYTIDARGLVNQYHLSAQDDVAPGDTGSARASRAGAFFESQNGLNFMAENTGGRFIHSKNDLTQALGQVLADQRGYYLIGYRPTEATFKGKQFHKIEVRVRRPNLTVRSRSGFFSQPDSEASPARPTSGDRQLYAALASPVGGADVRMQLSAFFFNDARAGSFVRSLLYINAQDITFRDEPNDFKKAVFDVAAVTFDEEGRIADEFNRTHTVRVGPDTYRYVLLHGLTYSADVPVKRAGAYQLRIVVRDTVSGRLGASGQFVDVPDVRGKQFALSGLVLGEAGQQQQGAPTLQPGATAEAAVAPLATAAHPATRRFRPGASLAYSYVIYNPRRVSGRPQLTTQARLFREGREVYATPETPFDAATATQTDPARLAATGTLALNADAQPGSYVLQLVVNDAPPGQKRHMATQWIDFEIVK